MNRCNLLQVKIQPTHRSGMGLKAKNMARVVKSCGANQRINIRRSIKQGPGSVSELAELAVISSGPA